MADKFQKLSGFGKLLFNANKNKLFDKNINNVNSYFTYSPEPAQPLPRDRSLPTILLFVHNSDNVANPATVAIKFIL